MPGRKTKKQAQEHRPPLHLRRCFGSGGKLRFPTESEAKMELIECRLKFMFQRQGKRREIRVYQCEEHCGDWHLTAMSTPPKREAEFSRSGDQMNVNRNKDNRRQPVRPARRPSGGGSSGGGFVDTGSVTPFYEDNSSGGNAPSGGSPSDGGSAPSGGE